ncbi:MAG TPA: FliG C-terminal domain-containing protein [Pirellulales bacterium]|jgi:flagellar motor switch protein FliG
MSQREPSIRKAAVLVASLDADTADLLLAQMPEELADAVRQEVLELDELDPEEQRSVIDEFFRIGPMMPEPNPPGVELDSPALAKRLPKVGDEYVPAGSMDDDEDSIEPSAQGSSFFNAIPRDRQSSLIAQLTGNAPLPWRPPDAFPKAPPVTSPPNASSNSMAAMPTPASPTPPELTAPPFRFLQDVEVDLLVPLLEREHPQAIALVLSHVPPEQAGHVLARLPAATQTDVVRRLVDLEETDPQVLREVELAVEAALMKQQPGRRRVAGMAAVSAILNASDRTARRQILNNLATHDRPLAHKLMPSPPPPRQFTFVEVCQLPPAPLVRVVRAAGLQTVVLAMAGAAAGVVDDLLDQLEPHEADRISNRLTNLGPVRLIDIDRAQEDLAHTADRLHADGRLPELNQSHLTAVV